ncbi:probable E3 ubiquitin-protein ligase RHC2A [Rutidosis leptorrhynchoides]|uniref:probable E3 ubiquitin-protein ligase RHC2A n=1 Tax=Rutidosis leptorrhynchoides TaxID=125765 RepID=UPI003A9A504A
MLSMAGSSPSSSYWCYRCSRYITVPSHQQGSSFFCPDCNGGFIEELDNPISDSRRSSSPASDMYPAGGEEQQSPNPPVLQHARRNAGNQSAFNPVIILRGHNSLDSVNGGGLEMYYDDGSGSGLRPLPLGMSDFLLGSGFDRLLNQLTQIEVNGLMRVNQNPPASKAAVEALPDIEIQETDVVTESHCAVCKEAFELQAQVKQMPCQHLYHSDCILPWLSLRNTCPLCRHEIPPENQDSGNGSAAAGLTIWRLPGGGFAVGRRGRERDVPVLFTEMDGGLGNNNGGPVRGLWGGLRRNEGGMSGGLRRFLGGVFSCFGVGGGRRRFSSSSSSSSDDGVSDRSRFIPAIFSSSSRRNRGSEFDVNNRPQMW